MPTFEACRTAASPVIVTVPRTVKDPGLSGHNPLISAPKERYKGASGQPFEMITLWIAA